eukprot:7826231-Alexandrium_andersonii.AAC.1
MLFFRARPNVARAGNSLGPGCECQGPPLPPNLRAPLPQAPRAGPVLPPDCRSDPRRLSPTSVCNQ